MVQVIGVFCTAAAECPVGVLVEWSVASPRFDSLVLLYFFWNFLVFNITFLS